MAKKLTKKFIAQPEEKTLERYPKAIRALIQKGREQRFVTHQELLKAMPEIEDNVILLDEIYTLFLDLGIEVIDVKNDMIWGKKESKEGGEFDFTEEDLSDFDEFAEEGEEEAEEESRIDREQHQERVRPDRGQLEVQGDERRTGLPREQMQSPPGARRHQRGHAREEHQPMRRPRQGLPAREWLPIHRRADLQ